MRWGIFVSKKIIIPGFDGLPLYEVASFFLTGLSKGHLTTRASAISFNFFLAVFPMILVFFTLIPFIPITGLQDNLLKLLYDITPEQTSDIIQKTVVDIIKRPRGNLLSFSSILALYFASNGFMSISEAFNNTYHTLDKRPWWKQRLISILLFFIITVIIILGITLIISGGHILDFMYRNNLLLNINIKYILEFVRWLAIIAMFFFNISVIYFLAPSRSSKFRFISAGSSLATVLSLLSAIGFNFYVQNFSKYNALYGSIGTLLIILIWIYFNAIILLIGFELNASIQVAKKGKHD